MRYHEMIKALLNKAPSNPVMPWSMPTVNAQACNQVNLFSAGGHPVQPPLCPETLIYNENEPEQPEYVTANDTYIVIFKFEGWQIEKYEEADSDEVDWISHPCPSYGWRYRIDQWGLISDGICPACCEEVPEQVMGVWKLKNFDKLPGIDEARVIQGGNVFATSVSEPPPWWA
jgi:hypothetical protein